MSDLIPDRNFKSDHRGDRQAIRFTYWDLWMLIVLSQHFKGDWDLLAAYFRSKAKQGEYKRDRAEGLLNHLRFLRNK